MRFLVTGATGFIGSHLTELIVSNGWEVICPVRAPKSLRNLEGIPARIIPAPDLPAEINKEPGFDYVIHVAGATRALEYTEYYEANVELTRSLLDLLTKSPCRKLIKRFVLVSSQAASGPSPDHEACVLESDPECPVSLYGRSKLEAERVARKYADRLPLTIVRPPTVFGPRDVDVLGVFKCARFRFVPCLAGPDRLVSIIYVEDLVEGILTAALSPAAQGETYFLANPEPVIWREFALLVARVMGVSAVALPVPLSALKLAAIAGDLSGRIRGEARLFRSEKFHEMKQLAWVCSPEKAYAELLWKPRFSLSDGIRKTARWYKDHGWL